MAAKKITQVLAVLVAAFVVMALSVTPAFAGPAEDNGKGDDKKAEQAQDNGKNDDSSEDSSDESVDHDGDADSDPATAQEDSHDVEAEQSPDDDFHPSGKDRSGESGGSGNQGKAESNPDDSKGPMRYEGALGDDKPAGPGGTDLDDQDGNNGCGNDDDFDDDNNGHCGRPQETTTVTEDEVQAEVISNPVCDADANMANGIQACEEVQAGTAGIKDTVLAGVITNPATPEGVSPIVQAARGATQPAAAAVLPFTGASIATLLAVALGLMAAGIAIVKVRSN